MREANRLKYIEEYYFSKKLAEIAKLKNDGKSIINLGIGSPDLSPSIEVIKKMQTVANKKDSHGYQSYRGIPEFRKAIADFYKKYYQVNLNYENEILPLTGSKEGIMHISMAFINPNDTVLIPNPGYMTYKSATLLAGGVPIEYDLYEENNYLPDLDNLEKLNTENIKLMWINYPHMPTGTIANNSTFDKIVNFAKRHNILIINDNPYSFILNKRPESILKYDKDFSNVMELNSLSKSHNMAGWRVGMLMGSEQHINAVMKFKSNMDSGMFLGTQLAAVEALKLQKNWFKDLNEIYTRRKKIAKKIFDKLNIRYKENQAGLFLWGKLPEGKKSIKFVDELLDKTGVFLAPGFIFGSNTDDYVRLSITSSESILEETLVRIRNLKI